MLSLRSPLWFLLIAFYLVPGARASLDDMERKAEAAPDRIVTRSFFTKSQNAVLILGLHEASNAPFDLKLKKHPSIKTMVITFTGPEYLADEFEELFHLMNNFDSDVEREYGARLRQGLQVTREEVFEEMLSPYLPDRL